MKNHLYYIYWLIRTWPMRWKFPKYHILSFEETIAQIIEGKKCISRFGDGEFRLLTKERGIYFQRLDEELATRLNEVLNSDLPNHLNCIPSSFIRQKNLKREVKVHWLNFINLKGKEIAGAIKDRQKIFGDALISRFYMDYHNKDKVPYKVESLQKIWENQEVLFVEGEYSRLGVGNDFFDNTKSIKRILCPSVDAFERYAEILRAVKNHGKHKLIIVALGPAATVLSYDLATENYWSLDLGHIDIEFMWYNMKATEKRAVGNKKSAEVPEDYNFKLSRHDQINYDASIICKIV